MKKSLKIISIILVQTLFLSLGGIALSDPSDYVANNPSASCLSPKLQLHIGMFQVMYQNTFQSIFDKTSVSAINTRSFQEHEAVLYEFGKNSKSRDFYRPDLYLAASVVLKRLYSDQEEWKNYIPVFNADIADRKIRILSIALFVELFKSAEFYNINVLNAVLDKIMQDSFIRTAKYPMATANLHYYVNTKDPNWFKRLWISILHELGHNIRFNMIDGEEDRYSKRHAASINEFFADLCPYIVSINNNWQDLIVLLRDYSKSKHIQSKKVNNGILIDAHLASQAQWYRLLRGVSIYSSRENLPKLVIIFHAALSEEYNNTKRFIEWIYKINGFGAKMRRLMQRLGRSRVSHGVEEILLADFSINSTKVENAAGVIGIRNSQRFESNVIEFQPNIIIHGRPFSVLCRISRMIKQNEGIKMNLRILNSKKESLLKLGIPLGDIRLPDKFFLSSVLPIISSQWYPVGQDPIKFNIKDPHYFQIEFISENGSGVIPGDHIVSVLNKFFSNTLKRQDHTALDVSFYTEQTEKNMSIPDADIKEISGMLRYKSSIVIDKVSFHNKAAVYKINEVILQAI